MTITAPAGAFCARTARQVAMIARAMASDLAGVLDEPAGHHDMGNNDILVDEGSGFIPGLKE